MNLLDRAIAAYEAGCIAGWEEDDRAPMASAFRALAHEINRRHRYSTGTEIALALLHATKDLNHDSRGNTPPHSSGAGLGHRAPAPASAPR
jgi:hypothetical protein